jgi:hypothetical protein
MANSEDSAVDVIVLFKIDLSQHGPFGFTR